MKISQGQKLSKLREAVMGGSVNRKIFGAAAIVGLVTTLVKALAVVKELVVAYTFGTSDAIDAFLIALIIPSLIITIIAGSFSSALIPTYIKVRQREGIVAAQKLFAGTTIWSIGLLVAVTFLMLATAPLYLPTIAKGFSPEKLTLTYQLLLVVSPMLILSGIATIWGAVLNAGERFALVALVPLITSAVTILMLSVFKSWGVFALAVGLIVGQLLEMVAIGIVLHKQGVSLLPKWHGVNADLSEVASQYAPSMVGSFLMCSTGLVDQSMAALLSSGSVASLNYGNRIVALPVIIASTAVSTVVMPYFSKLVASEDWHSVRKALKQYSISIFAVSVPLTLLIILFSEPIVILLLQRGSFNASDARLVAQIQTCFAFQIPFYIACMLLVRLISAMRNNQVLVWGSAGNLIVNIVLNYVFMQWLGVAGIALSTSFVYIFSFFFLLIATLRQLKLTEDLAFSPEQKLQMQELRKSKAMRISEILDLEQLKKFYAGKYSKTVVNPANLHLNLTDNQKQELILVRQKNIQSFRSILNPQQLVKIDRLQDAALSKIKSILTKQQLQQFKNMKNPKRPSLEDWQILNLTDEQKLEIQSIRRTHERQIK
jgi:putative peptidoglycan lipid II flippase